MTLSLRALKPEITITYCTQCQWMLRATWLAQELLSTFGDELGSVKLVPASGGVFEVVAGSALIWERKRDGGFPDAKTLKQRCRDAVFEGRALGAHLEPAAKP